MWLEDITHNHFLSLFDNNHVPDAQILRQELAYSTFIAPTFGHAGMDFLYLMGDKENKFIPLFTDMDEYYRLFDADDFNPMFHDFDYYLSSDMDLIVNPTSKGIKINVEQFHDMPETPVMPVDISRSTFSQNELKILAGNIQNFDLLVLLQKSCDTKEILMGLSKSTLLTQIAVENAKPVDGIVEIPVPFERMVSSSEGYLELFTGKNEITEGNDFYIQAVNLNHFFEYIIRLDLDGFILNPNSNHAVVDRKAILANFDEFKKKYNDSEYAIASNYAFEL